MIPVAPTRDYTGPPITAVPELADFVPDNNENTTASPFDGGIDAEYFTLSSKLTWSMDWADIVSVTGYRSMESQLGRVDQVGLPYPGRGLTMIHIMMLSKFRKNFDWSPRILTAGTLHWVYIISSRIILNMNL